MLFGWACSYLRWTGHAGLAVVAFTAAFAGTARAAGFPDRAEIERHSETRKVSFVGTRPGRPIPRPAGFRAKSEPAAVGRAFLTQHAQDFGLDRTSSLRLIGRSRQPGDVTAVKYQQVVGGVEVLGGEFVVQLDNDNNVLSVLGEAEPTVPSITPSLPPSSARRTAVTSVAKHEGVHAARLDAEDPTLRIFDNRIMGGPGVDKPRLAWTVRVGDGGAVRRLVIVDAHHGVVMASIDETPNARARSICDGMNVPEAAYPCVSPVLQEGGTYEGSVPDVQAAYDFSGAAYDFFHNRFGRDSVDGAGMPLISTVRYCPHVFACPYENAFWDGEQVVYGEGFAAADDVVAHELVHGLTQHTSALFYWYQSGAINESLSDIFGELIDQVTDPAHDAASEKWLLGEDLAIGAVRDLEDPTTFGHPDSTTSPHYYVHSFADNGGIHRNSGVGNKAAFLISDGGAFGGQSVTGLGLDKTASLYFAVQTGFLTSASDYKNLGLALGQACDNLVGTNGFSSADCEEVRQAVLATGMLVDRPESPDEPECEPGTTANYVFSDDMESGAGWTPSSPARWYHPQNPNPYVGWDPTWASSGQVNLWGDDPSFISDHAITRDAAVLVPPGAFLSFAHAFMFEWGFEFYDGGVIEYSTDGGSTWANAIPISEYSGTISSGWGNPLAGRRAFVGYSFGYRTTVAPLTAPAEQSVKLRFRIGSDVSIDDFGWFVDDVRIGWCGIPWSLSIDATSSAASEDAGGSIVVTRGGGEGFASVELSTVGGTATPSTDYTPLSTTVRFADLQTSVLVPLEIADDATVDPDETIQVALSEPVNGEVTSGTATLTIEDNDLPEPEATPTPTPPSPTPTPMPTHTPTPTPTPTASPAPSVPSPLPGPFPSPSPAPSPPSLVAPAALMEQTARARCVRRGRRLRCRFTATGAERVSGVVRDRHGRVVARFRGRTGRNIRFRIRGSRRGRHRVTMTFVDAEGNRARVVERLRIR